MGDKRDTGRETEAQRTHTKHTKHRQRDGETEAQRTHTHTERERERTQRKRGRERVRESERGGKREQGAHERFCLALQTVPIGNASRGGRSSINRRRERVARGGRRRQ